jgi:hypothetical protein
MLSASTMGLGQEFTALSPDANQFQIASHIHTLTILIPRFYNPGPNGERKRIEWRKLRHTISEMRLLFSGYTVVRARGWNREDSVRDKFLQFQIDLALTPCIWESMHAWEKMLRRRFRQRAMYMKVTNGSAWL